MPKAPFPSFTLALSSSQAAEDSSDVPSHERGVEVDLMVSHVWRDVDNRDRQLLMINFLINRKPMIHGRPTHGTWHVIFLPRLDLLVPLI